MNEPWFASATELAEAIRTRRLSACEALEMYLGRVARLNPAINAIVVLDAEGARARAAQADAALARGEVWGPLHGVPMTIKESHDRVGMPSTWGFPERRDSIATQDSVAVQRLERAGAVIFGKTNVPVALADFQSYNEIYGTTRNPWDTKRVPGGSSGGAAAAIAAGLTGLELGSDIGGSIRNPSHYCGVFGHKPTCGLLSPRGHDLGALRPIDIAVIGPIARSAADLELVVRALAGPDELDAAGLDVRLNGLDKPTHALRIAVWADDARAPVSAEVSARVRAVAAALAEGGAHVDETARPEFDPDHSHDTYQALLQSALSVSLTDDQFRRNVAKADALDPADDSRLAHLLRFQTMRHRDWVAADEARTALRWVWHRFFQHFDAMLMPVMPTTAFAHDHRPMSQRRITVDGHPRPYFDCLFWAGLAGVSYLPSTVIPTGPGRDGMPIGVQIVGPAHGDLKTIGLAARLEQAGFAWRRPPGFD